MTHPRMSRTLVRRISAIGSGLSALFARCTRRSARLSIALLAFLLPASIAHAACEDLSARNAVFGLSEEAVEQLQLGLRTALSDDDERLEDGEMGSYTRSALTTLCKAVPLPDDTSSMQGTLRLASDYGALAGKVSDLPRTGRGGQADP